MDLVPGFLAAACAGVVCALLMALVQEDPGWVLG